MTFDETLHDSSDLPGHRPRATARKDAGSSTDILRMEAAPTDTAAPALIVEPAPATMAHVPVRHLIRAAAGSTSIEVSAR
jgi:hypothetical protein